MENDFARAGRVLFHLRGLVNVGSLSLVPVDSPTGFFFQFHWGFRLNKEPFHCTYEVAPLGIELNRCDLEFFAKQIYEQWRHDVDAEWERIKTPSNGQEEVRGEL